jgi:hypothetical protein
MAGYAVECGLKSCIIRHLMTTDLFPEKRFSEQCWTHSLAQLLGLAGLKADMAAADPALQRNWDIAKDWRETSRYASTTKDKAEALYNAIADTKQGFWHGSRAVGRDAVRRRRTFPQPARRRRG